ncbi:MAG TPA: hypothetical protein VFN09_03245 [Rhodanobacteraceae bacterium]|nr:hypothetical protein [Rhodanobacteraceae bacterium]
MRRLLPLIALLALVGCATTNDYRYVAGGGGYYTRDADPSPSYRPGWWSLSTGYGLGYGAWGGYRYGYGYGAAYGGYWSYLPYYGSFWPDPGYFASPRLARDRQAIERDKLLQGRATATARPGPPRSATIRRFARPVETEQHRDTSLYTRPSMGVQRVMSRDTPRVTPRPAQSNAPQSRPYPTPTFRAPRHVMPPSSQSESRSGRTVPRGQPRH